VDWVRADYSGSLCAALVALTKTANVDQLKKRALNELCA